MRYVLIYDEDKKYGNKGFRIKGSSIDPAEYNVGDGRLIAHDIVEHNNIKDIGSVGDELMALAALWYVRGQFGDINRNQSSASGEENIASDILYMALNQIKDGLRYGMPVPIVRGCMFDESIDNILYEARKMILKEWDEPKDDGFYRRLGIFLADARRFMISGIHSVVARYQRIGGATAANTVFWNIAEAVDSALRYADYEGQEFNLSVVFSTRKVSINPIPVDWY